MFSTRVVSWLILVAAVLLLAGCGGCFKGKRACHGCQVAPAAAVAPVAPVVASDADRDRKSVV